MENREIVVSNYYPKAISGYHSRKAVWWPRNDFGNSYHQLASVQGNLCIDDYKFYSLITGTVLRLWITFVLLVPEM